MSNPPLPPPPEPPAGNGWTLPGSSSPPARHPTAGQGMPHPPTQQGYFAAQQTHSGYPPPGPQPAQAGYPGQSYHPGQPHYGYPYPAGGAWYPQTPTAFPAAMPGTVKAARVLLFVFGGIYTAAGLFIMVAAAVNNGIDGMPAANAMGLGAFVAGFGVPAVWAGLLFRTGRTGARAFANVAASLLCFIGLANAAQVVGLGVVAAAILIMVFVSNAGGSAWFKRPT